MGPITLQDIDGEGLNGEGLDAFDLAFLKECGEASGAASSATPVTTPWSVLIILVLRTGPYHIQCFGRTILNHALAVSTHTAGRHNAAAASAVSVMSVSKNGSASDFFRIPKRPATSLQRKTGGL